MAVFEIDFAKVDEGRESYKNIIVCLLEINKSTFSGFKQLLNFCSFFFQIEQIEKNKKLTIFKLNS